MPRPIAYTIVCLSIVSCTSTRAVGIDDFVLPNQANVGNPFDIIVKASTSDGCNSLSHASAEVDEVKRIVTITAYQVNRLSYGGCTQARVPGELKVSVTLSSPG